MFGHHVCGLRDDVNIVAAATCHAVVAAPAVEQVVACITREVVIPCPALQRIVTIAALDQIVTASTIEDVIARIAIEGVIQPIAGAIDVGAAGQGKALDIAAQVVVDAGLHQIIAGVVRFHHHIGGGIDHVGVIAHAAFHTVIAAATIKRVVAAITQQCIVATQAQEDVITGIAVDHVSAIGWHDGRVKKIGQDIAGAPAAAVCELNSVDRVVCIEEVLAHGEGFTSGQDTEHQVATDPGQADLVGVEIGQPNGVDVAVGATGIVDHIEAITLTETVSIAAASAYEQVIAGTTIQSVVITVAQECVIAAQTIEGVGRRAARQRIGAFITIYDCHDLTPYTSEIFTVS
ncbi:hypothetical protein D3C81_908660 [compost metagenome]